MLAWVAAGTALIGLGASIASLVDFLGASPTFCAEGGCATVRQSAWAHPLGIPMPVLGIAYFVAMLALVVVPRPRLRIALAAVGAVWAIALIALQGFVIHAWCKLCMIADPAAIAGALAIAGGATTLRPSWPRAVTAVPALGAIVGALALWSHHAPPPIPAGTPACVASAQEPGVVTVVEFVDFECPFCRALAPKLAEALSAAQQPVKVVRKMVPLPMHEHAMPAALAWCCADAQGRGEQMAEALFATPAEDLTPDNCAKLASKIGCDMERYRRDLPLAVGRVATDMLDARGGNVHSLPTVFVGTERLTGANYSSSQLVATINSASR